MSQLSVGKEVLSFCTKCKLTLAHLIVAMKDSKTVDKVMCKTCRATHTHKDPSTKPKTTVNRVIKSAKASSSKVTMSTSQLWEKESAKVTTQPKDYSIRTKFEQGDAISHPTFGVGFVEKALDGNKIEVLFKDEFRILVHNK